MANELQKFGHLLWNKNVVQTRQVNKQETYQSFDLTVKTRKKKLICLAVVLTTDLKLG